MAGQAEAGDVGGRVDVEPGHDVCRVFVEGGGGVQALLQRRVRDPSFEVGVEQHAAADGFGQDEQIARTGPGVVPVFFGVHDPGYGQAEFGFLVVGGVPACQDGPGLSDFVEGAFDDALQDLRSELPGWKSDKVQARDGPSAHGVDVAEGVGRANLTEDVRIVHRRRDEVRREHEGGLIVHSVDAGVVAGLKSHHQVRIDVFRQAVQEFLESDRTDFGRSPAGPRQACEGMFFSEEREQRDAS